MAEILESSRQGRLLRLALNRPEKRNALSAQLCRELVHTLESAQSDPQIGAVLLTGNGKHFCAGMDLSEVGTLANNEINTGQEQLFTIGSRLSKPLIAAVHGAALGGGMGLVANCHVVAASEEATFGLTEIRLGLWPFLVFRALSAGLGERRTVELSLSGRIFGAQEAKQIGLVHEVTADLEKRSVDMAAAIAESSPTAIHSGLTFVQEVRGRDWSTAGEIARRIRDEVFESADFAEGVRAFREKRKAEWPSIERGHH
ncbi:MAG TPA: enoyl-CoA hydratase-related protein [Bryobacteraceae bacterium]|jgi:enoyl-CoA hydratase/carnithine racemase|nr:enoyl-CoA hydratase-related protein [Bryobacteraceae bacterium]